jgi:hypothetical protein
MIISFYDKDLTLQDIVRNWVSLLAVGTYNTMGAFTLELQDTQENSSLVNLWQYCTIDNDNDNVYVITSVNVSDGKIILTGFPATYIFSKRASTNVINNKNSEQAMKSLVDNMTPWDNLVTGELKGLTDTFENQISDKQIIEYLQGIGQATDTGFRVIKQGNQLVFECYKPKVNNSVKYATSLKNVANLDYLLSDNEYYNVAIVAGAGEGNERVTVTAAIGNPTGTERRELYVDARNEQPEEDEVIEAYEARLEKIGLQTLIEKLRIENLSFLVENNDEVKLGDIINVSLDEYGIILQVRVTEEEIINQNNTTTRTISVGTPLKVVRRM